MQNIRSTLKIKKENVSNSFVLPHRMLIPFSRERCKVFFSQMLSRMNFLVMRQCISINWERPHGRRVGIKTHLEWSKMGFSLKPSTTTCPLFPLTYTCYSCKTHFLRNKIPVRVVTKFAWPQEVNTCLA